MNERDFLLFRLRMNMLDKKQKKELHDNVRKILKSESDDIDLAGITDDHVYEIMNKILIEKYGEMAVYDYIRRLKK